MPEVDESGLIDRSQAGDLDAFNRLVLSYQTPVYNLCFRLLGSGPAAEDATQEAFIAAFRASASSAAAAFAAGCSVSLPTLAMTRCGGARQGLPTPWRRLSPTSGS